MYDSIITVNASYIDRADSTSSSDVHSSLELEWQLLLLAQSKENS